MSTHLSFGLYEIDLDRIFRFIKQDIKDDWFQDPLHFDDRLNKEVIAEYIQENISRNKGVYVPQEKIILNVPKSSGTLRYSLETTIFDRVAYFAFVITLIEYFDHFLSRRIFNHRLDIVEFQKAKPKYLFLNPIEQWQKFEEFIRVDAREKVIQQTDVENYFENIRIDKLEAALFSCLEKTALSSKESSKIRYCIESLCNCLKAWSYNGSNGLAQNRDMSSFLANIYMMRVDEVMIASGFDYYRYMDDIKILCADKYEARLALKKLAVELRALGLTLNSSKTEMFEPDTDKHKRFLNRESLNLDRINTMIRSKKKPIVALGFEEVRKLLLQLQKNNDYSSRAFRFAIARICKIALCRDIVKPDDFFDEITSALVKHISELPHVSDQFYSYLSAVDVNESCLEIIEEYLKKESASIYGWQNYLLWKLLTLKKYENDDLRNLAIHIIANSKNKASIAGALLYLGRCGTCEQKNLIVDIFKNYTDFFLQRHALIALQEVEYEKIKESVSDYVCVECLGIYKTLKSYRQPIYIVPPEAIRYSDLIREVSFYA